MPKYLSLATYTQEGVQGLQRDGGTARRAAVAKAIEGVGGKMELFYFSFGDQDAVVVSDAPDNVSIAAISVAVGASGIAKVKTTVLLTPQEMDEAAKRSVNYKIPGR